MAEKILIIDDDKTFMEELKVALEMSGYDAYGVWEPSLAVQVADEVKPDIILLDMKMAGKSGFRVADDLKHFPGTALIPIIAMTGYFTEKMHKTFMHRLGIHDCILKPFTHEEIILKLESLNKQKYHFSF